MFSTVEADNLYLALRPGSVLNEFNCWNQIGIERSHNANIMSMIDSQTNEINSDSDIYTFLLCPGIRPIRQISERT